MLQHSGVPTFAASHSAHTRCNAKQEDKDRHIQTDTHQANRQKTKQDRKQMYAFQVKDLGGFPPAVNVLNVHVLAH